MKEEILLISINKITVDDKNIIKVYRQIIYIINK
jgi:hypothetical protein